jgi:preprotein translocase subunit SecA
MLSFIFKRFAGGHYRRFLKRARPVVEKINRIEAEYQQLSEEELRAKTAEFRKRFEEGTPLDTLLPEAFAAVKNAARRLCGSRILVCGQELEWNMIHYDVQLIGGMALHSRYIAEMATGEGKTLVATAPLYLNALSGKNCQLVTVNDYLARRDSEWMGYIYRMLGITVGCIQNGMKPSDRREAYQCGITYGTASEFGFDYLRDNGMATSKEHQVQRDHFFCIIDEADSILIDEARTPLIISGPMEDDHPLPFHDFKSGIDAMVRKQNRLCNEFANRARELLEIPAAERQKQYEDEVKSLEKQNRERDKRGEPVLPIQEFEDPYLNLVLVKWGMPKNKQLLRIMETPEYRKAFESTELSLNGDMQKELRYRLKEKLFYNIDERNHQADLTEIGRNELRPEDPDAFVLPDLPSEYMEIDARKDLDQRAKDQARAKAQELFGKRSEEIHTISQLLRAYSLYERDVEYVVQDGKVMIVDENTGRIMAGRRWSDGLHQAVEAKEGVTIEKETKTYATITIQNYFRLYEKLSGMTGTAETEASEFFEIYKINVMVIPTHRPSIRIDEHDVVYKTRRTKYNAVVRDIEEAYAKGQPVLVGTASVESSELLSRMLKRSKVAHTVLNAKYHQQEAEIVARAGVRGAITIATNMAGRGTDIKLGEGIPSLGGLLVLGTERHESRRIDRQLRGRCARQGDPGRTKFFVSFEDDLMRLFANSGQLSKVLDKSMTEDEEMNHPILDWSIENAQKKFEQHNFSIRKRLLQYDDVLNNQREVVYGIRNDAIHSDEPGDILFELIDEELQERAHEAMASVRKGENEDAAMDSFLAYCNQHFPIGLRKQELPDRDPAVLAAEVLKRVRDAYADRKRYEDPEELKMITRYVIIRAIDRLWQDHLTDMSDLRQSVSLRGYAQKDPLNEYKTEAFVFFEEMMTNMRTEVCSGIFRTATNLQAFQNLLTRLQGKVKAEGPQTQTSTAESGSATASAVRRAAESVGGKTQANRPPAPAARVATVTRDAPKVGRNDPCPCGCGKKIKRCQGA